MQDERFEMSMTEKLENQRSRLLIVVKFAFVWVCVRVRKYVRACVRVDVCARARVRKSNMTLQFLPARKGRYWRGHKESTSLRTY